MIIALAGLPGSGKTFVRQQIEDLFPNFLTFSPDEHENGWNDLQIQTPMLVDAPWLLNSQNMRFKQYFSQIEVFFLNTSPQKSYQQQRERGRIVSDSSWQSYLEAYYQRHIIQSQFKSWRELNHDQTFEQILNLILKIKY